jgi:hypothetical protein
MAFSPEPPMSMDMVMGPAVVGEALGEAAGAEAAGVAGLVVISNELYCERPGLQGPKRVIFNSGLSPSR